MNFSCKNELSRVVDNPLPEFYGIIVANGKIAFTNKGISLLFSSSELSVIRKIVKLANLVEFEREEDILRKEKHKATIQFSNVQEIPGFRKIEQEVKKAFGKKDKKSFLRGIYLGCGILSTPPSYHIEFRFEKKSELALVKNLLREFSVKNSVKDNIIYVTGRENVKQFVYQIGAEETYMLMEEDAINKKMINDTNRKANFEFANLRRQSEAAFKQVEALRKAEKEGLLDKLSDRLKEVALLRLRYPYLSLSELSEKTHGRLSKQSIYYRLKKIIDSFGENEKQTEARKLGKA